MELQSQTWLSELHYIQMRKLLFYIKIYKATAMKTFCYWYKDNQNFHWKRLWCWEGLGAGGEGDNRGWDGCRASLTRWVWVWVNSGSWWWTGRPGVLRCMGMQRVGHDWVTELNWTEWLVMLSCFKSLESSSIGCVLYPGSVTYISFSYPCLFYLIYLEALNLCLSLYSPGFSC